MDFDYDLRLRFAVFEHVDRLRRAGGGVVHARALNEGIVFEGERVPLWNQQKGIFRPRVLRNPGAALSFQTSFKDPYDDEIDPADGRFVYRYRGTDPNHPDNVALRTAGELGRPLLYLVGVEPGVYEAVFPCYVVADAPERLSFAVIADPAGAIVPGALTRPDADWPLKAYVTREVKQRLHQKRFRYLVLRAYRQQCAMCRLRQPVLLDAAHILPDREERGLPRVPNGLSLCRIHHGAYDVNIIGVDPDYRIHLRRDVLEEIDGPMLRHGLQELHGERIQLPRRPVDRPDRELLAERFERFRAA
ncbi:MAG TPA: HNH endonuclease [Longimicrobiales bacterium]|nr:HNH endonuclease [Longimicrobiales bacterium]